MMEMLMMLMAFHQYRTFISLPWRRSETPWARKVMIQLDAPPALAGIRSVRPT